VKVAFTARLQGTKVNIFFKFHSPQIAFFHPSSSFIHPNLLINATFLSIKKHTDVPLQKKHETNTSKMISWHICKIIFQKVK